MFPLPLALIALKYCFLYLRLYYVCRKIINYLRQLQDLDKYGLYLA